MQFVEEPRARGRVPHTAAYCDAPEKTEEVMLPVTLQFLGTLFGFIGAVLMLIRRDRRDGAVCLAIGFGLLLILALWRLFGVL